MRDRGEVAYELVLTSASLTDKVRVRVKSSHSEHAFSTHEYLQISIYKQIRFPQNIHQPIDMKK